MKQGFLGGKPSHLLSVTFSVLKNATLLSLVVFLWSFSRSNIQAQTGGRTPNTVITGVFKGDLMKIIHLTVDRAYIDSDVKKLEATIENDSFRFEFYLDISQKVTLKYLRNTADIYIEPGEHLHIDGDANNFYYSFKFSGPSAGNNDFLRIFSQKHRLYYSKFKYFKYKKGIVWYRIHRDMDTDIRQKEPEVYTAYMGERRDDMMEILEGYSGENPLTENFKLFMWAEINYYWAYHMLTYGYAFGFFHEIDFQDFFGFMYEVPLQNERALGSKFYRDYLRGAVNYYCEGPKKLPSDDDKIWEQLTKQFQYGEKELEGKVKAYFLSEIIREAYGQNAIGQMMDIYNNFLKNNPHKEFNYKVM